MDDIEIKLIQKGEQFYFKNKCNKCYLNLREDFIAADLGEVCLFLKADQGYRYNNDYCHYLKLKIHHIKDGKMTRINNYNLGFHVNVNFKKLPSKYHEIVRKMIEHCENTIIMMDTFENCN